MVAASDEEGVDASVTMINNTDIKNHGGWAALIAFIVFNMTTIPCFAAVATAKGELDKKRFWSTIGFWLATSYNFYDCILNIKICMAYCYRSCLICRLRLWYTLF